jgi:hypothetical protein
MEQILVSSISIVFNRRKGKFLLGIHGQIIEQHVCEFLHTISFLVGTSVEEYLLNTDSRFDSITIPLTGTGRNIKLDLVEFIHFREAYSRQMFLLKLQDALLHAGIFMAESQHG